MRSDRPRVRRGFTLIELLVAGLIAAFVVGAVSMSLSRLSRAKTSARTQLLAHMRADAALSALRRDVVSVLRDTDLFWTRLLVEDHSVSTPLGPMDRDEILVFSAQLRSIRDLDFIGDGIEFETQFRIDEDAAGPVLWQRRDAVPDEYERGGGVATPLVPGVVGLMLEAYDGDLWYPMWDSDYDGLPLAIRATVVASGCRDGQDPFDSPLAMLRTVIPIDRVAPPQEPPAPEDQDQQDATDEGTSPDGDLQGEEANPFNTPDLPDLNGADDGGVGVGGGGFGGSTIRDRRSRNRGGGGTGGSSGNVSNTEGGT